MSTKNKKSPQSMSESNSIKITYWLDCIDNFGVRNQNIGKVIY